jgi:protein phosphatase
MAISEKGRRERNEDAALSMELGGLVLLAVADGLGGHARGDVASRIAIENLRGLAEEGIRGPEEFFRQAYEKINSDIRAVAGEIGAENMATTLTAALVDRRGNCTIANLGDSRAYVIANDRVKLKTKDHSYVQELIDDGAISEGEVFSHPMKNILTRALGLEDEATPDFYSTRLEEGDVLLLSTDGLHDYVGEGEIAEVVSSRGSEEEIARALIEDALKASLDNVSIALLRWRERVKTIYSYLGGAQHYYQQH